MVLDQHSTLSDIRITNCKRDEILTSPQFTSDETEAPKTLKEVEIIVSIKLKMLIALLLSTDTVTASVYFHMGEMVPFLNLYKSKLQ